LAHNKPKASQLLKLSSLSPKDNNLLSGRRSPQLIVHLSSLPNSSANLILSPPLSQVQAGQSQVAGLTLTSAQPSSNLHKRTTKGHPTRVKSLKVGAQQPSQCNSREI